MTEDLTDYEVRLLREMNGEPQEGLHWGAAMSVAIEELSGMGLVTRGPKYAVTEKGKAYLAELDKEAH